LGKSPESLETLLVPIMLGKLPEETKKNMARTQDSSEWTVEQLQAALLKEIRIFEAGQQTFNGILGVTNSCLPYISRQQS